MKLEKDKVICVMTADDYDTLINMFYSIRDFANYYGITYQTAQNALTGRRKCRKLDKCGLYAVVMTYDEYLRYRGL